MALEKKNVAFPFLKGRNDQPGDKNQMAGELTEMKDLQCLNTGQLQARKGFLRESNTVPAIPGQQTAGLITSGTTLINSGDEVIILDGKKAYTKGMDDVWVDRGEVVACEYEQSPIETTPMGTSTKPCIASINGYEVQVWVEQPYDIQPVKSIADTATIFPNNEDEDGYRQKDAVLYYQVKSKTTGALIVPKTSLESQVTRLRSAGQWRVPLTTAADSGGTPIGFTGDLQGLIPLGGSGDPDDYIAITKEQVNGNLAQLRQMTDASVVSLVGRIETLPIAWTHTTNEGSDGSAVANAKLPTGGWIWEKTFDPTEEIGLYIDYTKGDNTMYYQMKPKLIPVPDKNCMILIYANGDNSTATKLVSGNYRLFYRVIDLTSGQVGTFGAAQKVFPSAQNIVLDRRHPTWDADVFFKDGAGVGDEGGFCIAWETAPASVQHTGGEDNTVKVGTWGVTRDVSDNIVITAGSTVTMTNFKLRHVYKGLNTTSFVPTWFEADTEGPSSQPIPCGLAIKCIAKYDAVTKKLVSDSGNKLLLALDYDGVTSGPTGFNAQILLMTLDTTAVLQSTEGLFDTTGTPKDPTDIEDIDTSAVRLVDMAVAQHHSTGFAGYYQLLFEVVDTSSPTTRFIFNTYGATTNQTWLIAKKTGVAGPKVLFRNVSIVSDGLCNPNDAEESYFCVSGSGQPQSSEDADLKMMGRICMVNFSGRVVATWEQFRYSSTSDSGWFATGSGRAFENNQCLKEQRSRLCFTPDVEIGDMLFGINQWDKGILIFEQDWLIPCRAKFTLNPSKAYQNTVGQGSVYVASGLLWKYAGSKFTENEFLHGPQVAYYGQEVTSNGTYAAGTAGGHPTWDFTAKGGLEVGTYKYYFNYFWRDASGDQHISDYIAMPEVIITTNSNVPLFRVYGIQLTNHRSISGDTLPQNNYPVDAVIQIWRTLADSQDGPAYLVKVIPMEENKRYYDTSDDPSILSGTTLGRDVTNPQLAPGINTAVAQIESGYPHFAPECPVGICYHRGHLIISTTANQIWSSRQMTTNFTASFTSGGVDENVNMWTFTPNPLERITHVQSVGTSFYCFSRNNVYSYTGDGPDASAAGDYTGPELVAPNMGIKASGICEKIPDGLVYQGQKGYYLLQGGQSRPIYFGGPVADYAYAVPVGCVVNDKEQHIIIALGGSTPVCLVYNWEFQMWGTWHFYGTNTVNEIAGIVSYIDKDGTPRLSLLGANGRFWRQKIVGVETRAWEDETTAGFYAPSQTIETTWLQLPTFHGSMRVYKVGLMFSSETEGALTLKTYTDWDTTEKSSHALSFNTVGGAAEPLEMVARPTVQKCKSFKAAIVSTITANKEPPYFDGLAFLIGTRKPAEMFVTEENLEGA